MKLAQKLTIGLIRVRLNVMGIFAPARAGREAFQLFCTPVRRSKKEMPSVFKEAEPLEITLSGKRLQGFRWHPEREKKVLIAHGFESSSYNFDRYVRPLLDHGFGVVAFDAPAHGRSEGKRITVHDYMAMLEMVSELYGPFHGIMAHSFGCMATALWSEIAAHPPVKLAFIAPATETGSALDGFFRLLRLNKAVRKAVEKLIENVSGHPSSWFSIPRVLSHRNAEVLWIHDKTDTITPFSDAEKFMNTHPPHVRFMITEGWGHRHIYREKVVVDAVASFF